MASTAGKKLAKARTARGLSIDEAAHATKLRPDKIVALENDDYSRFANNAYAKGFLNIYARFLKVDVSEATSTLPSSNPISVAEYQYLSNAPAPRPSAPSAMPRRRQPPSLLPLAVFVVLAAVGMLAMWIYVNNQRIVGEPAAVLEKIVKPEVEPVAPVAAAAPVAPPTLPLAPPETLASETSAPVFPSATPAPSTAGDRDFVVTSPVASSASSEQASPAGSVNEVLVASIRKTWVTIRKDDLKASPVFEDFLWPGTTPLKLKGARFFIEAREPEAVQITKNGLPFTYPAPDVPVQ